MPPRAFVSVICARLKLETKKWRATACIWFTAFLEKPLVKRVNRRECIRIVRFARLT